MTRVLRLRVVLVVMLAGLVACQPSRSTSGANPLLGSQAGAKNAAGPVRDLSQDEAAGGHVLRKHVGRSDAELRERLEEERHISGASTYTDRATAEHVIGAVISQSQGRIEHWLSRTGGHANLVLDYDSDQPIGRTMNRGDRESRPYSHAIVVLRYDPPDSYHVLTSYPECR